MLCTASAGVPEQHGLGFLSQCISEVYNDMREKDDLAAEATFTEFVTAFLALMDAFLQAVGCVDTESKLLMLQTLALTSEEHFKGY